MTMPPQTEKARSADHRATTDRSVLARSGRSGYDVLTVRTNCPGLLTWHIDGGEPRVSALVPAGGVMAGVRRHHVTLGPFPAGARDIHFRFRCTHHGCDGRSACCQATDCTVQICHLYSAKAGNMSRFVRKAGWRGMTT